MTDTQHLPRLGVSAAVWRDGRVLLVQRARPPVGIWAFPGGHVEPGEKLEAAAARELHEETGMTMRFLGLAGLYDVIRRDAAGLVTVHYVIACFAGIAGPGEPVAASDALAAVWADTGELGGFPLAPNMAEAIISSRAILASNQSGLG